NVAVPVSRPLMQEEINVASTKTAGLTRVRTLTPPPLRKEAYALAVGVAVTAVLGAVFSGVFLTVLPRYFDPFGDHPPYSATRLSVDPAGATVDYGENVAVRAIAAGVQPDDVTLVLADSKGAVISELPMLRSSESDYRQTIEHAKQDYKYFAKIDGGRSKRY